MGVCKNRWRRELEKSNRQQELPPGISELVKEEANTKTDQPQLMLMQRIVQLVPECNSQLSSFKIHGAKVSRKSVEERKSEMADSFTR